MHPLWLCALCADLSIQKRLAGQFEQANLFAEKAYQLSRGSDWDPFIDSRGMAFFAVHEAGLEVA